MKAIQQILKPLAHIESGLPKKFIALSDYIKPKKSRTKWSSDDSQ